MKRVHLLRTRIAASDCEPLLAAATEVGVRVGWLDLESVADSPPELEQAAASGAFRAVGVIEGRVLTVKPVRGALVITDLLREHFAGCRLVVIRGDLPETAAPELMLAKSGYRVRFEDGTEKEFAADALAKALRRPRLWKPGDSGVSETAREDSKRPERAK